MSTARAATAGEVSEARAWARATRAVTNLDEELDQAALPHGRASDTGV